MSCDMKTCFLVFQSILDKQKIKKKTISNLSSCLFIWKKHVAIHENNLIDTLQTFNGFSSVETQKFNSKFFQK